MENGWLWIGLGTSLFFITFGGVAVFMSLYFVAFGVGALTIVFHYGKQSMIQEQKKEKWKAEISEGLKKVIESMEPTTKIKNFDKRMTGASVIDDVLKEVLEFTVRDYIKIWYRPISDHDSFLQDIWQCAQKVIITFSTRSKSIDWMPYFTQRMVDDFASHIRLYRRALDKTTSSKIEDNGAALESSFFDMEVSMEENRMCRDLVCLDAKAERQYLQDLSDMLLYLLLPTEDFHNKPFRYIIREVLVNGCFLPTIEILSDPDYINQNIAWLCLENSFFPESFLTVIRASDHEGELEAVREKVDSDIAKWRSKDTGGSDDTSVKLNLNSLMFVRDTCDVRLKRLKEGITVEPLLDEPDFMKYQSLYALSLDDIFNNNVALQSFIEYLKTRGGEQYLFFYLNVEGFRTAAEQQISEMQKQSQESETPIEPDLGALRKLANIIYDQYLSDKASVKLKIEPHIIKYTVQRMKYKIISEDVFDSVQARVYQILHVEYYEDFLQCPAYVRLLGELGFLDGGGDNLSIDEDGSCRTGSEYSMGSSEDLIDTASEDMDTTSLTSVASTGSGSSAASVLSTPTGDVYLKAQVTQSGIVKENDGKSYAVFAVNVRKKEPYAEDEEIWDVFRRYSDFHDLHMILTEKFADLKTPNFPGKTVLKKTSQTFLDKRKKDLDKYLRGLMHPELLHNVPGLEDLMCKFLQNGVWEKHKSEFSGKMDTFVNPIKSASKSVGNVVKSVPHGVVKIGDGIGHAFTSHKSSEQVKARELRNQGKVGAGLDPELAENIPLRIMLLLMDEVFDLRGKQWLRRRISVIIRQLIKATFGDKINRKIVEHVDFMTSADQVAEYIVNFRNSFWPNGVLAEPQPPRDLATKNRTRVLCKAKMLGSVPDEVKTLMGTDSVRKGVARIFQMFQHKNLNKRFVYVVLEGVLANLFPDNKFKDLFRNLHSGSTRAERLKEQQNMLETHQKGKRPRSGRR